MSRLCEFGFVGFGVADVAISGIRFCLFWYFVRLVVCMILLFSMLGLVCYKGVLVFGLIFGLFWFAEFRLV